VNSFIFISCKFDKNISQETDFFFLSSLMRALIGDDVLNCFPMRVPPVDIEEIRVMNPIEPGLLLPTFDRLHCIYFQVFKPTQRVDHSSLMCIQESSCLLSRDPMLARRVLSLISQMNIMTNFPTGDLLQIIVEYLGFCPALYLLRETSNEFKSGVDPVVRLPRREFLAALRLRKVNHRFLRLRKGEWVSGRTIRDVYLSLGESKEKFSTFWEELEAGLTLSALSEEASLLLSVAIATSNPAMYQRAFTELSPRRELPSFDEVELSNEDLFRKCFMEDDIDWLQAVLCTMRFRGSDANDLILFALECDADKCLKYLCEVKKVSWWTRKGCLPAVAKSGKVSRLQELLQRRIFQKNELLQALKICFERGHSSIASLLLSELSTRYREQFSEWRPSILVLLEFDLAYTNEDIFLWFVNHLDKTDLRALFSGYTVLDKLILLGSRSLCELAVEKGIRNYQLCRIVNNIKDLDTLEWFVQFARIDLTGFKLHYFRDISNVEVFMYLVRSGVSLVCEDHPLGLSSRCRGEENAALDWLALCEKQRCLASHGKAGLIEILKRDPVQALCGRRGDSLIATLRSFSLQIPVWDMRNNGKDENNKLKPTEGGGEEFVLVRNRTENIPGGPRWTSVRHWGDWGRFVSEGDEETPRVQKYVNVQQEYREVHEDTREDSSDSGHDNDDDDGEDEDEEGGENVEWIGMDDEYDPLEPLGPNFTSEWEMMKPDTVEMNALREIEKVLIQFGADPSKLLSPYALLRKILNGSIGFRSDDVIIIQLIEGGADVNAVDPRTKMTALEAMIKYEGHEALDQCKLLLKLGASVQGTALIKPLFEDPSGELIKIMIDARADVNLMIPYGGTDFVSPLQFVTSRGREYRIRSKVELLLENGADPNLTKGTFQDPPLHNAVKLGYVDVVDLLMAHQADLNIRGPQGATPLHWAALRGDSETVEKLLDAGADPHICDDVGWTPMDKAAFGRCCESDDPSFDCSEPRKYIETIACLEKHGCEISQCTQEYIRCVESKSRKRLRYES
jgi:hypothetical protein